MPDQLQLRGGTTTEHNSFTGALREVTVDTTKKTVVVHDGSQAGGTPLMKESGGNAASTVQIGSGGVNALTIDGSQDITLTGASANVVWDKSANSLEFADNAKAIFGTGDDFTITHDGSNARLINTEGNLILFPKTGEYSVVCIPDGAVELYFNNAKKFETTSGGVLATGDVDSTTGIFERTNNGTSQLEFNSTSTTKLKHLSNNQCKLEFIGSGNTFGGAIDAQTNLGYIRIKNGADEQAVMCRANGAVELYHDNSKKFETSSSGTKVTGMLHFAAAGSPNISLPDNGKIAVGQGDDLQIFHDGSHTRVHHSGTGQFIIYGNDNDQVKIMKGSSEEGIILNNNGNVELYYDNSKKFETTSSGVHITGTTFLDDSSRDDGFKAKFGTGDDLQIFHDGSESYVKNANASSNLILESAHGVHVKHGGENMARFIQDGAVELYYDNSLKFLTNTEGTRINGQARYADDSGTTGGFTHCLTSGTVANNGTFTAQTHNCHAGGLVTITTNRRPSGSNNKNISVFPIVINSNSTASLGTALSSMAGSSGSSFSVAGASQGVIVTNTSGLDQRITVRFDITGI